MRRNLAGARNRLLQVIALYAPGGDSTRVRLHRLRGVEIGEDTWIGYDTLIEPSYPHRVVIGRRVAVGMRVLILAHFAHHGRNRESSEGTMDDRVSVRIEDDAFIGSDSQLIAPVTVGDGAYVGAGSTITRDVPPGSLALTRAPQTVHEGWATQRRRRRKDARGKD